MLVNLMSAVRFTLDVVEQKDLQLCPSDAFTTGEAGSC